MAKTKKKKTRRTRSAARLSPPEVTAVDPVGQAAPAAAAVAPAASVFAKPMPAIEPNGRWDYVRTDIRRISILITACIILEIILALLFNNTGLGESIYSLVKL